jgi:hypothetical protein
MVAAAGADELEQAGVAAVEATAGDADRLAPHERRPAVAGLTGRRECHGAAGRASLVLGFWLVGNSLYYIVT